MNKIILYHEGQKCDSLKEVMEAALVGQERANRVYIIKSRDTPNNIEVTKYEWNKLVMSVMNRKVR